MRTVILSGDEPDKIIGTGKTEAQAVRAACVWLKCDFGPLAAPPTGNFAVLADRVHNAFGGEMCVSVTRPLRRGKLA